MNPVVVVTTDLRHQLGAARDQGPRPTCLAVAASDLHAGLRPSWTPLSCETAFFHAQRRAGRPPSIGATLPHMLQAIHLDGQPVEAAWPYLPSTPTDLSAWSPPPFQGDNFKRAGAQLASDWVMITALLDQARPVLLLLMLSPSFYGPDVQGVVKAANDEVADPALRHAVLAVGHGTVDSEPAILIRNSWGETWGNAGHAWLPAGFVAPRLFGMALLDEDDDVSPYSAAA